MRWWSAPPPSWPLSAASAGPALTHRDLPPGKRPLSSMAPTILAKDGKLFMVTGSPGGSEFTVSGATR